MLEEKQFLDIARDFCASRGFKLDEGPVANIVLPIAGGGEYLVPVMLLDNEPETEMRSQVVPPAGKTSNSPQ